MNDRGNITILVCTAAFVLMLGALALADAGAFLLARQRAHTAAAAAALAAVVQQVPALAPDGDPVAAARAEAERNGAVLMKCECAVGSARAIVVVEIARQGVFLAAWVGRRVHATAAAEVDDGLTTYRPSG